MLHVRRSSEVMELTETAYAVRLNTVKRSLMRIYLRTPCWAVGGGSRELRDEGCGGDEAVPSPGPLDEECRFLIPFGTSSPLCAASILPERCPGAVRPVDDGIVHPGTLRHGSQHRTIRLQSEPLSTQS